MIADPDLWLWGQYAVRAWPTAVFVDPRGRVVARHEGEFDLPDVRDFIAGALARAETDDLLEPAPWSHDPLPAGGGVLRFPGGVLGDPRRDRLFAADSGHHRVVVCGHDARVVAAYGSGEPGFADGPAARARFRQPRGLALDPAGSTLFVADEENHAVRAVDLASGRVATVAGTGEQGSSRRAGSPALETPLSSPTDLAVLDGRLWIAMAGTHQLWTLDLASGALTVAAGSGAEGLHDGPLAGAAFAQPSGLATDPRTGALFVADAESSAIRRVAPASDRVRRLVGRGLFAFGDQDGTGDEVRLQHPLAVAAGDDDGPMVFVADTYNDKIKRLDPATRRLETVAGGAPGHEDGPLAGARFRQPSGLALAGRRLYVADTDNHAIRRVNLDAATVETLDVRE
ncbi:MAG: alkyl hydroperoxide reductase [Chloroflexota bacterium]|nr:alkyl hydroperoxide reductase [Chloroflexota bacterium]